MPLPGLRESDVQKAVVEFLAFRGCFIYRQNAGGLVTVDEETGKKRFIRLAPEGASDWTGWHKGDGRSIQCEVKVPGKEPTVKQYAWLKLAESQGAIAFWADSVEMAEAALKRYGI